METEALQKKSSSGFGPGPALAKAREALGLTHEDVAERLRLAPNQVQAIEADDYDHLPGPTYVRGYLRSYAELVGLKPGPVLEAYGHVPAATRVADLANLAPKDELTSQHRHVRLATYFMVALIIALAVSWWQGRARHHAPAAVSAPASAPTATPGAVAVPASVRPEVAAAAHRAAAPVAVAPVPATAGNPAPRTAPTAIPRPAAPPTPVSMSPVTIHAVSPGAVNGPAQVGARAQLVLTMMEESWVDVRDAQGNKLLYETVPAGRVVTLDGNAPLKVFLGNAAGVRVVFDGKLFNSAPYLRGQVARFTLGAVPAH